MEVEHQNHPNLDKSHDWMQIVWDFDIGKNPVLQIFVNTILIWKRKQFNILRVQSLQLQIYCVLLRFSILFIHKNKHIIV